MIENKVKTNYHTHCTYCDGKEPIENFVNKAVELGYDQLGFSSHAPVPFENDFGIREEQIPEYTKEIDGFKTANPSLQLFYGLECDFIPGMTKPFAFFKNQFCLDYIIGGVHLVRPENSDNIWFIDGSKREIYDNGLRDFFGGNVKKAVTRFWEQSFEMIETEQFDVIAHFDKIKMHNQKRYFTEEEEWYKLLVDHCIELIRRKQLIVEINTRGIYKGRCPDYYPSDYALAQIAKHRIPMVVSTDAHKSEELAEGRDAAIEHLKSMGIKYLMYRKNDQWEEYAIV